MDDLTLEYSKCESCYYYSNLLANKSIYNRPNSIRPCSHCNGKSYYVSKDVDPKEYFKYFSDDYFD